MFSFFNSFQIKIAILLLTLVAAGIFFYMYSKKPENPSSTTPTPTASTPLGSSTNPFTIIAFGDSLTAGYGVPLEESYPAQLERLLIEDNKNVTIINMGVSGETTTGALDRVDFIIAQKPSLVLLGTGANDMLRASSPTLAQENIRKIVERFKQEKIDVVLLGMKSTSSNGNEYVDIFDSIYPTLSKEYNLPLVPFFLQGVALTPSLNTGDGIHPNKAGYEKIIKENILPVLLPVLKSKGL